MYFTFVQLPVAVCSFLLFSDEGLPLEVERFLRQSLKSFSYTHSIVLKQMIATLTKIPLVSGRGFPEYV